MPVPKGQGIAEDSGEYEDLADAVDEKRAAAKGAPPRKPSAKNAKGIADDASEFEDLVNETTDKARTLESDWLYQLNGQVFGPVKPRHLLELLYSGEINADTPIALSDGDFAALQRYGVFRVHLPKVAKHQQELAEAKAEEQAATKARLRKRLVWIVIAILVAAGTAFGLVQYVRGRKEEMARAEAKAKEAALLKEIDDLMASVTIEPPLIALVDDKEKDEPSGGAKRKSRRAVARFTTVGGGTGELTRDEIMGGIASIFPGFKRCIVEQIRRDAESVPEQIVLSFSIDNDGVPRNVGLADRTLRNAPIAGCMTRQVSDLRFRKYKGEVQNIEYPITIGRR